MNGRALPGFPFLFFIGENGTNAEFKVLIRAKLLLRQDFSIGLYII